MPRWLWFILGVAAALVVIVVGGYLFVREGGVPMSTSSKPLPFEASLARLALHASYGNARDRANPLPFTEENMVGGAREYREHCVVCHGAPGQPPTAISQGMFPPPPQLFQPRHMVTDDPPGITFWKVTNGIRLSGMPGLGEPCPRPSAGS